MVGDPARFQVAVAGARPGAGGRYVRSMVVAQRLPEAERLVSAVASRIPFDADGAFRVRTRSGCLICT